jgi:hypothetical protein
MPTVPIIITGTFVYRVTINDSFVFKTLYCPKYYTNRKLTKFVMFAPVGSTSSVPLENGDKARKEF